MRARAALVASRQVHEQSSGNECPGEALFGRSNVFTRQIPASDLRDWADIRSWASALVTTFAGAPE